MIVNLKEKLLEILPEVMPEDFRNYLNSLNEENFIIIIPTNENRTTTERSLLMRNDLDNEVHQMLDEMYLRCIRMNNLSEFEKKSIQMLINDFRALVIKMIHSFDDDILKLKNNVIDLEKQIDVLQQQESNAIKQIDALQQQAISTKRSNIVSEILFPIKKIVFQEMAKANIPTSYYNVNILKSILSSYKNDTSSAEFYLYVHRMNNEFSETTLNSFRNLLFSIISDQSIDYETFLNLLIEKEKRNFEQQSTIVDFIKDSHRTNDARLTTLLRQQEMLFGFQLVEIEVLDTIYLKYFNHLFTRH